MGTAIDRFLAEHHAAPDTGQSSPDAPLTVPSASETGLDRWLSRKGEPDTARALPLVTDAAASIAPEQATKILQLQQRTQLPVDLIERNLDAVTQAAEQKDFDAQAFRRTSPIVAQWMAEHPANAAAAAGEEKYKLAALERIANHAAAENKPGGFFRNLGRGLASGLLGLEQGAGHLLQTFGELTDKEQALPLNTTLPPGEAPALPSATAVGGKIIADAKANQEFYRPNVGSVRDIRSAGNLRDYLGFQLGSGASSIASIVAATAAGGPAGGVAAAGTMGYGDIRGQMQDMGVQDSPTADLIALGLDIPITALQMVTPGQIAEKLALGGAEKAVIREAATSGLTMRVARTAITHAIQQGGVQAATTAIQYLGVHLTAGKPIDAGELAGQILDAAVSGALAGGVAGGAAELPEAVQARRNTRFFQAIGDVARDSKLVKELPQQMQDVVSRITQNGPVETVYAPVQQWTEYWQSKGVDPAQAAEEVIGSREPYVEALQSGADLAIPTARYATTLAPSEHNNFFVDELRLSPGAMNGREARELRAQVQQTAQETTPTPTETGAESVQQTIADRLEAAGRERSVAETESKLLAAMLTRAADEEGVTPQELLDRYGLDIQRAESPVAPQPVTGDPIGLQELANRAIAARENAPVREAERTAARTEQQLAMYDVPVEKRDAKAKTDAGEFVYARTPGGALRTNLETVSTDGVVDELARLLETNSQENTAPTVVPDENMHTSSDMRPHVSMKGEAVRAAGRIAAREKSIAKLEAELERRGVTDVADRIWRRLTGQDLADATDFSFDQGPRREGDVAASYVGTRAINDETQVAEYELPSGDIVQAQYRVVDGQMRVGFVGSTGGKGSVGPGEMRAILRDLRDRTSAANGTSERISGARPGRTLAGALELLQSAFHGSPHLFDEFSLHKIGTGEGNQAYGWGMYFAGQKSIAEFYRRALSTARLAQDPEFNRLGDAFRSAVRAADNLGFDTTSEAVDAIRGHKDWATRWDLTQEEAGRIRGAMEALDKRRAEIGDGRLYKVDIPEDDTMLDWDKPLSEQPEPVKRAIAKIDDRVINAWRENGTWEHATGANLYAALARIDTAAEHWAWRTDQMSENHAENTSRYLASLGIDGIRYLDHPSRAAGEGSHNYVVFDDKLVKVLEYEQRAGEGPRGRIRIGPASIAIDLFPSADLSTFVHETGHFAVQLLQDQAFRLGEGSRAASDLAALRDWVGAKGDEPLTREQHEQIARGFEAYLMEGKAPSSALRSAFARIRAWMLFVYKQLRKLHVELTPEVRTVFDRLLASDEEIQAAEAQQGMAPLFNDPKAVGMSEAEAQKYSADVEAARQAARDELAEKAIAEVRREQTRQWKEERAKVRAEVAAQVNQEPASLAYSVLRSGTLPDGSEVPEAVRAALFVDGTAPKLDRQALVDEYATRPEYEDLLRRLPRGVYAKEGGIHPDQAAETFGFGSGDELIQSLLTTENPRRRIEALTDQRMHAEHGDLLTDGTLPVEAMKAVHTEQRAEVLRRELQHLASDHLATLKGLVRKITRRIPSVEDVRAEAERTIGAKRVREINPLLYQRAEAKAAKAAVAAFLKGDIEGAFTEKQRELLNHELYRAATTARETVDGIVDYMRTFDKPSKRARLGKAGGEYLEQIDAIRERYDFARISNAALARRHSLLAFVDAQEKEGIQVDVPDELLAEAQRRHYKDASLEELVGVRDTVKQIEHLARVKNQLLASARAREMDAARTEIVNTITENLTVRDEPAQHARGLGYALKKGLKRGIAEHTRMEFLFRALDGQAPRGVVWQYFFKPMAEAENHENAMRRADAAALTTIFSAYSRRERARWFTDKIYLPEARTRGSDGTFTKATILSIALNWGNEYNRDALMRGYGWNEAQVERILAHLDARDWRTVQAIWDHLNTYWPDAQKLEREVTGLAPEKVEAQAFAIRDRSGQVHELTGGYYPIVFDQDLSTRQAALDEAADVSEMFGGLSARAMTRHGHLKARQNTGGKPLLLELSVLSRHLNQVIHDLAYRRAVIDVAKLVRDDQIRETIEGAVGREMHRQLGPWLKGIAGDRPREYSDFLARLAARARQGATVVGLGLKMTSAITQTLGFTNSVNEIGAKYAALGLRDAYRNPFAIAHTWEFISERSQMMRDRVANFDRDVRDQLRRPSAVGDLTQHGAAFFTLMGWMDMSVSIPTWLGAYRKAMDGELEHVAAGDEQGAIDYADSVVRTTQAAGAAKDLAAIQRGGEVQRLFTMFYSSMSILFNQFEQTGRQFALDRNAPRLVASLALLWFVPAVLEDLMKGRGPNDDSDESWMEWLARKELLYPFQLVVGVRDIAQAIDKKLRTGENDFSATPVADVGASIAGTAGLVQHAVSSEHDVTRSDVKSAVITAGYIAHLPTRQLWQTGEYLYDWMTGDITPSNPATGLFQALVGGRPK